eukprot:6070612-Prymnesium_polylepis.1
MLKREKERLRLLVREYVAKIDAFRALWSIGTHTQDTLKLMDKMAGGPKCNACRPPRRRRPAIVHKCLHRAAAP